MSDGLEKVRKLDVDREVIAKYNIVIEGVTRTMWVTMAFLVRIFEKRLN